MKLISSFAKGAKMKTKLSILMSVVVLAAIGCHKKSSNSESPKFSLDTVGTFTAGEKLSDAEMVKLRYNENCISPSVAKGGLDPRIKVGSSTLRRMTNLDNRGQMGTITFKDEVLSIDSAKSKLEHSVTTVEATGAFSSALGFAYKSKCSYADAKLSSCEESDLTGSNGVSNIQQGEICFVKDTKDYKQDEIPGTLKLPSGQVISVIKTTLSFSGTVYCGDQSVGAGRGEHVSMTSNDVPSLQGAICGGREVFTAIRTTMEDGHDLSGYSQEIVGFSN
jgi:hypothetical protein